MIAPVCTCCNRPLLPATVSLVGIQDFGNDLHALANCVCGSTRAVGRVLPRMPLIGRARGKLVRASVLVQQCGGAS